jgi:hypothetical protein
VASVGYLLCPVFLLLASWSLLRAYDERDRRLLRLGLGCLAAAVLVTAAGVAFDHPSPAPASSPVPVAAGG